MNPSTTNVTSDNLCHLRPALPGLLFAVLTLLFGFGLGIVFGLDEDAIKSQLKASAAEVRETVYRGDDAAIETVLDKAWVYMQRAHLHAGGLGATAIGLILVVVLLGTSSGLTRAISLGPRIGRARLFNLLAGGRISRPGLGGATAAKESLKWRTLISSGTPVIATAVIVVILLTESIVDQIAFRTIVIPTIEIKGTVAKCSHAWRNRNRGS